MRRVMRSRWRRRWFSGGGCRRRGRPLLLTRRRDKRYGNDDAD